MWKKVVYCKKRYRKEGLVMFRLKLEFRMEKPELPREMDSLMVSFLKASLQNYSQELYEAFYEEHKSVLKNYAFSFFLPGARFEKEKIFLNKNHFTIDRKSVV